MVRKLYAGRVKFHDGESQVAPGVTVHKIGGHSKGLQCVRVKTRRGYVVLASDCTHLYRHFETGRVFPTTYNPAEVLEGYDTLRRLATSDAHVIRSRPGRAQALPGGEERARRLGCATRRRSHPQLSGRL
jgi:glyoxylase-like metal-dependent hydrolase (beta-lactamase superfamily II)